MLASGRRWLWIGFLGLLSYGCERQRHLDGPTNLSSNLNPIADAYVRLVLAVGRHDPNYVDAYYGPKKWQEQAAQDETQNLDSLLKMAQKLLVELQRNPPCRRGEFLIKQLTALHAFVEQLQGKQRSLDEEARLLYDMTPPQRNLAFFENAIKRLDALLPGEADLINRIESFQKNFIIPEDRMETVLNLITQDTRKRTRDLFPLPNQESFRHELVQNKPWGGYNWYQGNLQSLIQINTDQPTDLLKQLKRMAHEGYPGHHTYNLLLEERLVWQKGFREYTVYPLFAPHSLLAEGTANLGLEILYSPQALLQFLSGPLAEAAGIKNQDFERYLKVMQALEPFRYASAEAARMLLDQQKPEEEVLAFLMQYGLFPEGKARQTLEFIRTYRSYIFTYFAGEDLIREWLDLEPEKRVSRFFDLLTKPVTPTQLQQEIDSFAGS